MTHFIGPFSGPYRWLSNFWLIDVMYEGILYPSTEHAYQAAKCINRVDKVFIAEARTPGDAKRIGRQIAIREDWDDIKLAVMEEITRKKYHDKYLRTLLDRTGNAELIEINTWGDRFWGVCNGTGQNHLGKILMRVRAENRA